MIKGSYYATKQFIKLQIGILVLFLLVPRRGWHGILPRSYQKEKVFYSWPSYRRHIAVRQKESEGQPRVIKPVGGFRLVSALLLLILLPGMEDHIETFESDVDFIKLIIMKIFNYIQSCSKSKAGQRLRRCNRVYPM